MRIEIQNRKRALPAINYLLSQIALRKLKLTASLPLYREWENDLVSRINEKGTGRRTI
jgi:hypothetical protein